jgi:hypothetical protein
MTRTTRTFAALLIALTAACRDVTAPAAPSAAAGEEPGPEITLNVLAPPPTTMGWLAPLGKATAATPQNTELRPVVTVCRWVNSACTGSPVAQFSVGGGLTASTANFSATWNLSAANLPLTRARFRIAVTLNGTVVGLPILVDAMRGRWALSVPGQTPTLVAAASVPLQFRIGTPAEPPPPVATVTSGLGSAQTQFLPGTSATDTPRSTEQTTSLTTLSSTLASLQTALTGPRETALLALSQAASAADFAFQVAQPGDKADLDVIRLELAQAGKLLGVSN